VSFAVIRAGAIFITPPATGSIVPDLFPKGQPELVGGHAGLLRSC